MKFAIFMGFLTMLGILIILSTSSREESSNNFVRECKDSGGMIGNGMSTSGHYSRVVVCVYPKEEE